MALSSHIDLSRPKANVGVPSLRSLLRLDATVCALSGVIALVASSALADLLDVARGWVLGVGAFLVVYAAGLLAVAHAERALIAGARVSIAGDAAWVAATVVLVAAGVFSGAGIALMAAVALVVGALGVSKAVALTGS
jgi:hypothetical protein